MRSCLRIKLLVLCLILSYPTLELFAQEQWQSTVSTLLGIRTIPADPHPLSYWTANPISRHKGDTLCFGCPRRGGGVITPQDYTAESNVRDVGTIAGYRIVQVDNRVVAKDAPPDSPILRLPEGYRRNVAYKILLVQTGSDEYREIYHLENDSGVFPPLTPARIIQTSPDPVLVTMDRDGGNGGGCNSGYWSFDKSGPHPLNFVATDAAIRKAVPENAFPFVPCPSIDFDTQQINAWALSDAGCRPCVVGNVNVHFVVRGSIVEPTRVEFIPRDR
jgi:hypothetical protein